MHIEKREGFLEKFNGTKIKNAIKKAYDEVGEKFPQETVKNIINIIKEEIQSGDKIWNVEDIQDRVERELLSIGEINVAKAYIKYRQKRTEIRDKGWQLDELQNAIWSKKYQYNGESFDEWVHRVSGGDAKVGKLIKQKKFIFAGRILAHRGLQNQNKKISFSNCYVMPKPDDNLESIFDTAKMLARTYSYGGGCGLSLSNLRPKGTPVNNSARETSGATSFMSLYDLTTDLIGQNGRR